MRRSQVHGQVDYRYHSVTAGYVRRETLSGNGIATLFFLFSTKRGKESEWHERRGERAQSHTPSAVRE